MCTSHIPSIRVAHPTKKLHGSVVLTGSKSESNRALIIRALSRGSVMVSNLSDAEDTSTLSEILNSIEYSGEEATINVGPAGTAMRFLTAYLAITPGKYLLTGNERMLQRPIKPLVDALQSAGALITYADVTGYPPLKIIGQQLCPKNAVHIDGSKSSQYISAILMIGPLMTEGLQLIIEQDLTSVPYMEMTLTMMAEAGITFSRKVNEINIPPQKYRPGKLSIEGDWSSASYWYSIVALSEYSEITISGLKKQSRQGDRIIANLMTSLGVETIFEGESVLLQKHPIEKPKELYFDFKDCPDLAQTVLVCAGISGINVKFTGVETLKIKETDRIQALSNELKKLGISINNRGKEYYLDASNLNFPNEIVFDTYDDHRMAMSLAPISLRCKDLSIRHPAVVSKSYPTFWQDLRSVGFDCTEE